MIPLYFQHSFTLWFMITLTSCAKCPPIIKHSITAQCKYEKNEFPCNNFVEPGTVAQIKCAFMYQKSESNYTFTNEYMRCNRDGTWNKFPFECEQICGTIGTKVAFSVNSQVTEVQKVPWQVGIYMSDSNGTYHHICGGTLVKSNVIISAAHCFWNPLISKLYNESNYIIAAGKFYRDFYANNETFGFQLSDVSNIKIPSQFSGADYDYVSDIAVVTLKNHILFKNHIRPACLPWNLNEKNFILNNKPGVVAGWGVTNTGSYSPELRSVELTAVHSEDCKRKVTRNNKIPNDKFCVDTDEGRNVCRGDSGGGFLVPIKHDNITYFYVWGVVSNGLIDPRANEIICNSKFVTTFTNLQLYQGFVTQLKIFHRDDEYNMGCLVPRIPFLYIKDANTGYKLFSDTYAQKNTKVRYECAYPIIYKFVGNYTNNTCEEDWVNPHPKCLITCPTLEVETTVPRCHYEGKQVDCVRPLAGTIAKIECAFMYEKPHYQYFYENIRCKNDGFWNYSPIQCEQICGTIDSKLETNTTQSFNKKVPWQISIYFKSHQETTYEYVCSGTLIHSKIVLSAAQCFWDSKNSTLYDLSSYIVTAGNFYRDYYAIKTEEIQSSAISNIHIISSIWGPTNNYSSDIAVLTLRNRIIFENHIRPACLIWENNYNINDNFSVIADWHMNSVGLYVSKLCSIDLLYENCIECDKKLVNREYENEYCSGDDGSALLVPKIINNVTYYYLLGILSNTPQIRDTKINGNNFNRHTITFNNILNFQSIMQESIKNSSRYEY
ncbi:uncharacterized protein LOC129613234 [Condylostylus longicornis]|uniref:uncharacterized protein LOC129613234 n=1 Tax=Condylostylus longicornis TaxID=2530218 RepID=UPI00244E046A|nr:uncharacterized protein LOC129613234 [Condylostylus longicornis]